MRGSRASRAYDAGYIAGYQAGARLLDTTRPTTVFAKFVNRLKVRGRALELGCGEGRDAIFLAKRGFRVVAFDTSSAALSRARRRAREEGVPVRFETADMAGPLPFPDASFDLVAAIDSFHLVTSPRDRARHFREVGRVLKPGGFYFFCNHVAKRPRISSGNGMETVVVRTPRGDRPIRVPRVPYAVLTKKGYARAIRAAGFLVRTARAAWMFPIQEPAVLIVGEKPGGPVAAPGVRVGGARARRAG